MKKIKIFSALALTLVMASCDNFDLPNPPAQSYPEPDAVFENGDIDIAPVSELLNLTDLNNEAKLATVANVVKLNNFPEGFTLSIDMEVASDVLFTDPLVLSTSIEGDAIQVIPDVLNGAVQKVLTKKPGTYDLNARFIAYAQNGTTRMRLGGIDKTFCDELLKIQTFEATKVIEDAYYVVPCDAAGTPDFSKAIEMKNIHGEGLVGYDYPEFAIYVDSPEPSGMFVKIAPQSVMVSQDASSLLGVNDAGRLGIGEDFGVGKVSLVGPVLITINAETDSFVTSYALEALYPYNDTNKAADLMLLYTQDYMTYTGVTEINNKVFFGSSTNKKKAPLYYQDETEEPSTSDDGLTKTGMLSLSGTTQIVTPLSGKLLYWVEINLPLMNYSMTAIQTLSVVGNANGWNEKEGAPLAAGKNHKIWTASDVEINGEFKIVANKDWTISFSGTKVQDTTGEYVYQVRRERESNNFPAPEAGYYDVTLDFSSMPYILTLKAK